MFCIKCGNRISESDKFCEVCGAKIEIPAQSAQQNITAEVSDAQAQLPTATSVTAPLFTEPGTKPKKTKKHMSKKKKTAIFSVITAAVVVIAVGAVFAWDYIENFAVKTFSSPTGYYHYVETKNVDQLAASVGSAMGKVSGSKNDFGYSGNCKIQVGDTLIDYIAGQSGIDSKQLKWLSDISMSYDSAMVDGVYSTTENCYIGTNSLIGIDVIFDTDKMCMYLRYPQLKEQYLKIDLSSIYSSENYYGDNASMAMMTALLENLPDDETSTEIISRYLTVIVGAIDDVKEESDTITANGVSQKCTKLTATIDEKAFKNILKALLKEVKNDDQLEDIFKDILVAVGTPEDEVDDMYDDMIDNINKANKEIDSINIGKFEFDIITWVDGSGNAIGRRIDIDDADVDIYYLSVHDGSDVGYELCIGSGSEKFEIVGGGVLDGDKMNGSYKVMLSGDRILNVDVKDYNVVKAQDGYINGTFTMTLTKTAADLLEDELDFDSDFAELIPHLSFALAMNTSEDSFNSEISVNYDKELLVKLTFDMKKTNPSPVAIPSDVYVVDDEDDFEKYFSDIDIDAFIKKLGDCGIPTNMFMFGSDKDTGDTYYPTYGYDYNN